MKKCLQVLLPLVLILISANVSYSQKGLMEKMAAKSRAKTEQLAKRLKSSELVVVLLEENPKVLSKLKGNSEKLVSYKEMVAEYNKTMKAKAPEYITFTKGVKFLKLSELQEISVSTREKYNYLYLSKVRKGPTAPIPNFIAKVESGKEDNFLKSYKKLVIDDETKWAVLQICELTASVNGKASSTLLHKSNLPKSNFSEWGIVYALSGINMSYGERELLGVKAKEKTLLICEEDLAKSLKPEAIKSIYKNKYKVVSREEYARACVTKDSKYMCIVITPLFWKQTGATSSAYNVSFTPSALIYSQTIYDCETGQTISFATNVGVGPIGTGKSKKVSKKSLKKHQKFISAYQ